MVAKERIIVSMTSWYKRIDNVPKVLETLLHQTLMPTKIILNLCTEDFPNMTEDLPPMLVEMINDKSNNIELYWFIENYKAWKKHLHVLEIASVDDLIISTDDDHLYPEDFIEKMYVSFCYYDKQFPITLNKIVLTHNMWCFNGPATLYKKEHFGNYKKYLTYDVLHKCIDDHFINILMAINKTIPLPEIFHFPTDDEMLFNDTEAWTDRQSRRREQISQQPIQDLRETTLDAMENSLDEFYFNFAETRYTPKFWNIVNDAIEYTYNKYGAKYKVVRFLKEIWESNFLQANYDVDFKSLDLDIDRHNKEYYIGENNKIVIAMSSWPKRIGNTMKIINDILHQTVTPDKIILTLSKDDFGIDRAKNVDMLELVNAGVFPKELYDIFINDSRILIRWVNDGSLKSWKKHIGPVGFCNDNDVIITIDDDILYKETFIETMIKSYNEYGRNHAVSCGREFCQGGFAVYGYALLYTPKFINFFDKSLFPDYIFKKFPEDNHILNVLSFNNHCVLPVIGYNYLFYDLNYNQGDSNFGNSVFDETWWNSYKELSAASDEIITEAGKTREELNMRWKPTYFNFTIGELIKYTESFDEKHSKYVNEVKTAINAYLSDTSKNVEVFAYLREVLDDVIL